jgi:hypothetical protein
LRQRWYLWGLVYAVLAIPAAFIVHPHSLEDLFQFDWDSLLEGRTIFPFILCLLVFSSLFLIARLLVWITDLWRRNRVSRGNQGI